MSALYTMAILSLGLLVAIPFQIDPPPTLFHLHRVHLQFHLHCKDLLRLRSLGSEIDCLLSLTLFFDITLFHKPEFNFPVRHSTTNCAFGDSHFICHDATTGPFIPNILIWSPPDISFEST